MPPGVFATSFFCHLVFFSYFCKALPRFGQGIIIRLNDMFKNFTGFNLVEQMHRLRHAKRFNPLKLKRKSLGLLFVAIVFLVLWFLPTESFGLDGLTQVQVPG